VIITTKYPYVLAVILGLSIPFIPQLEPYPIILGLIYFIGGGLFGFLWPKVSWRWGLWIVIPVNALLALSILFTGDLEVFLKKDLPVLFLAIISACLGSFLFAWFRNNRTKRLKDKIHSEQNA
jgi:hypothetical protein